MLLEFNVWFRAEAGRSGCPDVALIGGEGWSVSSSAIEGRAGVSEANRTGIIGDKRRVEGQNRPQSDVVSTTPIADRNQCAHSSEWAV